MHGPFEAMRSQRGRSFADGFVALAICIVAATTAADVADNTNNVERVQQCFNAAYNSTPTTFGSFMSSLPVSLNVSRVWASTKEAKHPLTVFTTATLDRLHHLEALCRMLPGGSVSAAVYLPLVQPQGAYLPMRNQAILRVAQKKLQDVFQRVEAAPEACSLRLLLLTEMMVDRALASLVPINALRNAALLAVRTPLVAMIDVDLATSDSLSTILTEARRVQDMLQATLVMWVLPAWEAEPHLSYTDAQNTVLSATKGDKARLSMLWGSRHLRTFSEDIYPQGHNATDYRRWLSSSDPYTVRYIRGYEPWGVTARERYTSMPYDIRFRGCFRDKVTQVASLAYSKLSFVVVPDAWLVHQPHDLSAAASIAVGRKRVSSRVQALQQVVSYRGLNTTKFMLHKAHSLVTSDEALGAMAAGTYEPVVGDQFLNCRASLPWV